ncbi:MAG: 3-methyladenine DNA glycosylase, partial [Rhodoglobus sp.]
ELGGDGLFPRAARLARDGADVLRGPRRRIATILAVAEAVAAGDLVLDVSTPVEEFTQRLQKFSGIGP